jgi:hypothetical protein
MNVPMLYVNPVTGPNAGRRWLCYVCQFGSAPVLAAFVKREKILEARVIGAVQKLSDKHAKLHAFVVCLSGPDPELEKSIRKLAEEEEITVPLTVLPEQDSVEAICKMLPIERDSDATALLYRGRQVANVFRDMSFEEAAPPPPEASCSAGDRPMLLWDNLRALAPALFPVDSTRPRRGAVEHSTDFREMDRAVATLVQ